MRENGGSWCCFAKSGVTAVKARFSVLLEYCGSVTAGLISFLRAGQYLGSFLSLADDDSRMRWSSFRAYFFGEAGPVAVNQGGTSSS
jgi:hypothetical protein